MYNNDPPLGRSLITALCCDRRGKLWIGKSVDKLSLWQNHQFNTVNAPASVAGKWINAICENAAGVIRLAVQIGGIISLETGVVHTFGLADGLNGLNSTALAIDKAGTLWALNDGKLDLFNGDRWSSAFLNSDYLGGISSLAPAAGGGLWLATSATGQDLCGGKICQQPPAKPEA